jgi:hypothetical protein
MCIDGSTHSHHRRYGDGASNDPSTKWSTKGTNSWMHKVESLIVKRDIRWEYSPPNLGTREERLNV